MEEEEKEKRKEKKRGQASRNPGPSRVSFGPSWFWADLVLGRVGFGPTWFWAELTQERCVNHAVPVSIMSIS